MRRLERWPIALIVWLDKRHKRETYNSRTKETYGPSEQDNGHTVIYAPTHYRHPTAKEHRSKEQTHWKRQICIERNVVAKRRVSRMSRSDTGRDYNGYTTAYQCLAHYSCPRLGFALVGGLWYRSSNSSLVTCRSFLAPIAKSSISSASSSIGFTCLTRVSVASPTFSLHLHVSLGAAHARRRPAHHPSLRGLCLYRATRARNPRS